MKELKKTDEDKHKDICTKIREDGAYVEAGENDNLLVQKVSADPGTLGVLGYSFLEENADKVAPVSIAGIAPTEATISDLCYPGSAQALHLCEGRAHGGQAGDQGFRRGLCQGLGQGRAARAARPGAVRRRRCERCDGAGDARSSRSTRRRLK